jgi:hypothetical protein
MAMVRLWLWNERRRGIAQVVTNFVLAIVGIVAVCIYGSQLKQMQRQGNLSKEQILAQSGPNVGVGISEYEGGVQVALTNDGQYPARDATANIEIQKFDTRTMAPVGTPDRSEIHVTEIRGGGGQDNDALRHYPYECKWLPQDWVTFWAQRITVRVLVDLKWEDGFGDRTTNRVCQFFLPPISVTNKQGGLIYQGNKFENCSGFGRMIDGIEFLREEAAKGGRSRAKEWPGGADSSPRYHFSRPAAFRWGSQRNPRIDTDAN